MKASVRAAKQEGPLPPKPPITKKNPPTQGDFQHPGRAACNVGRRGHGLNRPGFAGGSNSREAGALTSNTTNKFSSEVRDRAVRMVLERE
ncbi:MAG TPA: hypothetical protein PKG84_00790, partial [Novosphingobium sp.]|nr:hypothetical protein [Novosphingobium sp.]